MKLQDKAEEVLRDMAERYFSDEEMKPELRQKMGEYIIDKVCGKTALGGAPTTENAAPLSLSERLAIIERIRSGKTGD